MPKEGQASQKGVRMTMYARHLTMILRTLAFYGAACLMAIPAYATCDISGYWSFEAEDIALPRNPFVQFEPSDDETYKMVINICGGQLLGTATAARGWIAGEIEFNRPPPPKEIMTIWELTDDCQWANGWIYVLLPGTYGNPPIKSSLRKLRGKFEAD